jgi:hypothetical protein
LGFLAQQIYDETPLQQASYLLEAVSKKKMEKLYGSAEKSARMLSDKQVLKPAGYNYYQYLIEQNVFELSEVELKRSEKGNFEKIIQNLDEFYLADKIKWYHRSLSHKSLVAHEYKHYFVEEILAHIKSHDYTHNAAIIVNFQILMMQQDTDNESYFFKLVDLLNESRNQFPLSEQYSLYNSCLNYCIQKLNKGNQNFVREYHELFKFMLHHDIIFHSSSSSELSPFDFKNAVQLALRLGEYDWAEKFINNYKDRLPENFKVSAFSYNLALVYFYQKKFDKVKEQFRGMEYKDLAYNLDSKSMLIAIYYEQDQYEALISLCDTFKTYLQRHKDINENMRVFYLNYVNYTRRLVKIMPGKKSEVAKLREDIMQNSGKIVSQRWLLEKLKELE